MITRASPKYSVPIVDKPIHWASWGMRDGGMRDGGMGDGRWGDGGWGDGGWGDGGWGEGGGGRGCGLYENIMNVKNTE